MQTAARAPPTTGARPKGCYKCGGTGHWAKVGGAEFVRGCRCLPLAPATRYCPVHTLPSTGTPLQAPHPWRYHFLYSLQDCIAPREQWLPRAPQPGTQPRTDGPGMALGAVPGPALPDGQVGLTGDYDPFGPG